MKVSHLGLNTGLLASQSCTAQVVLNALIPHSTAIVDSSPGHSQILSRSRGEKSGETSSKNSSTQKNREKLLPIFLHGCKIKSGSGQGMKLVHTYHAAQARRKLWVWHFAFSYQIIMIMVTYRLSVHCSPMWLAKCTID